MNNDIGAGRMARRFRGFLPVVVDVETGGFNCTRDALLQIAAVLIELDDSGRLVRGPTHSYHVKPFEGANIEPASLQVNKIDPWHPLRPAIDEREALQRIFKEVRAGMQRAGQARHPGGTQFLVRSVVPQRRGGSGRRQALPVPPLLELRHSDAGGRSIWADRAGEGGDDCRPRLGHRRGAFGHLRCRTHRGTVLHYLQ